MATAAAATALAPATVAADAAVAPNFDQVMGLDEDASPAEEVELRCRAGGASALVPRAATKVSQLLSTMLEHDPRATTLTIDVPADLLPVVAEYMRHHGGVAMSADECARHFPRPLPIPSAADQTPLVALLATNPPCADAADLKLVEPLALGDRVRLTSTANYLGATHLLYLACAATAAPLKGKTADEVRALIRTATGGAATGATGPSSAKPAAANPQ